MNHPSESPSNHHVPTLLETKAGLVLTLLERVSNHDHADVFRGTVQIKAGHNAAGEDAAIKIYRPAAATSSRARAAREEAAHAAIAHPCLAELLTAGETADGRPYVASAWINGVTLEKRLQRGRLCADELLNILRAVGRGLAALHSKDIIHRDIKPSNIMLPENGPAAMLLDFGHALHLTEARITETSQVLGSASYMSPEQVQGNELDGRSDLYSLGVVLFTCLTGSVPYRNTSAAETMLMHVQEPIPSLRDRASDAEIPDALADLCYWLMAKNPAERLPNARVLQLTLDAIAVDNPNDTQPAAAISQGHAR